MIVAVDYDVQNCPAFLLPIYLLVDLWKYSKIKIL